MVEKKTVLVSFLSVIASSLFMFAGVSLYDHNAYYCKERSMAINCDGLTKYYGLDNGKCLNKETGNKLCKSGWIKIESNKTYKGISNEYTEGRWLCSQKGCIPIK